MTLSLLGGMPVQIAHQETDSAHQVVHGLSQLINDLTGGNEGYLWLLAFIVLGAFIVLPRLIKRLPWFK